MTIREFIQTCGVYITGTKGKESIKATNSGAVPMNVYIGFVRDQRDRVIAEAKAMATEGVETKPVEKIEGLEEIKRVSNEWARYHHEYNRRFEAEDYRALAKPETTVEELKNKYPRAAAYLKAQSWTYSDNVGKYGAGKAALERIIAGEDHEQVLAEMETEWSEYTQDRMWD
jgi:hypothetical protein